MNAKRRNTYRNALRRPHLLPLAAAMLLAHQAHAQSATETAQAREEAKTLDGVEVSAKRVRMAEIGGQASTLRETPQSVTVIDREQLDKQNLYTLDHVLVKTPGVVVLENTTDEQFYSIRGQDVNSFQWDGITMESYMGLNTSPNMAMFEEVQVLRGANGVLNAAKSFGSINLIRKRPLDYFKIGGSIAYGSWNNLNTQLDVTGPLTDYGRLRGRGVVSYGDRDYYYDVSRRTEKLFYGALEYDLAPNTLLTVTASEHHVSSVPFTQALPRLADGGDPRLPRSTFLGSAWNRFKAQSTNVFASIEHRFENGWSMKLAGTTLNSDSFYKNSFFWATNGIPLVDDGTEQYGLILGNVTDRVFDQKAADLSVQGQFDLFGRQHEVVFGGSYYKNDYTFGRRALTGLGTGNARSWDPYALPEPPNPETWQVVGLGRNDTWKSLYATSRFHLGDAWTLTTGARSTWYTRHNREYNNDTQMITLDENLRENAVITPYAGLVWDFSQNWSAYVSYADIFIPQSVQTYEGDTLDPQVGANYEAGLKAELAGGRLNAALSVFRVDKTNEPMLDLSHPPVDGETYYVSAGKTRSKGFDLEVSGRVTNNWSVSGGYTRNTTERIAGNSGVGLPFVNYIPKHMFRMWTDYTLPFADERLSIGGSVSAQSRIVMPVTFPVVTDVVQGGWSVYALRFGYRISDTWNLGLNINNVTDKVYYPKIASSVSCCSLYGEPRNYMLTLRADL